MSVHKNFLPGEHDATNEIIRKMIAQFSTKKRVETANTLDPIASITTTPIDIPNVVESFNLLEKLRQASQAKQHLGMLRRKLLGQ